MGKIARIVGLCWSIIAIIASIIWMVLVFVGPIFKMEQSSALAKSSLNFYSRNTYIVETLTVACMIIVASLILGFFSLLPKKWLSVVTYIVIALAMISAFATVGYFGYNYFHLENATNDNMGGTLSLWEEKFGCCGWDVYRAKPLCGSDVGSVTKITCKVKTEPLQKASLQNFIIGCFFILVLSISIGCVIVLQMNSGSNSLDYTPL
ncbi:Tetraspanin family protein [Entamoeba marina]